MIAIKRKAEIYSVDFTFDSQISIISSTLSRDQIKANYIERLKSKLSKEVENNITFKDAGNFIEIYSVDSHAVFGIIGKSTEVKDGVMKRIKSSDGKSVKNAGLSIEDYRYFLFDLNTFQCIVMRNNNGPNFKTIFRQFLSKYKDDLSGIKQILVEPKLDENIYPRTNRWVEVTRLKIRFDHTSVLSQPLMSLQEHFDISNNNMKEATVTISLQNQPVSSKFSDILEKATSKLGGVRRLEIEGIDENDNEDTVELVERYIIKKVRLEISEDELIDKSLDKIKLALLSCLKSL